MITLVSISLFSTIVAMNNLKQMLQKKELKGVIDKESLLRQ